MVNPITIAIKSLGAIANNSLDFPFLGKMVIFSVPSPFTVETMNRSRLKIISPQIRATGTVIHRLPLSATSPVIGSIAPLGSGLAKIVCIANPIANTAITVVARTTPPIPACFIWSEYGAYSRIFLSEPPHFHKASMMNFMKGPYSVFL